jgi:hypothetical protein
MDQSAVPSTSTLAPAQREATQSAFGLFWAAFRRGPLTTGFGLILEYLMFASAVFLALSLYLTRVPMRFVDRVLGLRLRERFIELIARLSPG